MKKVKQNVKLLFDLRLTHEQWEKALRIADKQMKDSNGHFYWRMLKTRCSNCGRSPKQKGKCSGWFQTFIQRLETVLLNKMYLSDDYKDI